MCGVFAVIDFAKALGEQEMRLMARAGEQLAPRGPDAAGLWRSPCGHLALGHRRLAVVDLSPAGEQPMHDVTGRYHILFNGEIYNYRELRTELMAGYAFRTGSDTEVIMAAWMRWGADCLPRLRGMFAFVLWDSELRTLHVARDAFGIKPIYMRQVGSQLWLASQVKALTLVAPGLTESPAAKAGFYLWGSVPEPLTPFNEITALPAGHCVSHTFDQSAAPALRNWFNFSKSLAVAAEHAATAPTDPLPTLREAMLDTVRAHRVADVPVGVFLSAGLDSTTLAALSCELNDGDEEVQTVTLAFSEYAGTAADEAPLAEAVARQLGTRHTTIHISQADFSSALPHLFAAMDQPSYDGVNTYFVSKATREAGLKVALSGLGGDELFGGYASFTQVPRLAESVPGWLRTLGPFARQFFSGLADGLGKPKLAGLLEYGGSFEHAYLLRRALYMPWELDRLMPKGEAVAALEELATLPALLATHCEAENPQIKLSLLEAAWFMRNQLLRDSDWASMSQGLELRVPLVDTTLWQKVLPLRAADSAVGKRQMAQTPLRALPAEIMNRPKTGFSIPVAQWLADADSAHTGQGAAPGLRPWAQRVWSLWMTSVPRYVA